MQNIFRKAGKRFVQYSKSVIRGTKTETPKTGTSKPVPDASKVTSPEVKEKPMPTKPEPMFVPPTRGQPTSIDSLVSQARAEAAARLAQDTLAQQTRADLAKKISSMPKEFAFGLGDSEAVMQEKIEKFEREQRERKEAEARRNKEASEANALNVFNNMRTEIKDPSFKMPTVGYSLLHNTDGKFHRVFVKREHTVGNANLPKWELLETQGKDHLTEFDFKKLLAVKPTWEQLTSAYRLSAFSPRITINPASETIVW